MAYKQRHIHPARTPGARVADSMNGTPPGAEARPEVLRDDLGRHIVDVLSLSNPASRLGLRY